MKLTLIEQKPIQENVISFVFKPEKSIEWLPGQYMHYVFEHPNTDDRGVERWFTISTAPFEKNIQITTRFGADPTSSFKQALRQLRPGDSVEADGPKGKFVLREGDFKHILIAGGIGITPYRSMLAQAAHDCVPLNATLLYANSDDSFVFGEELDGYAAKDQTLQIKKFVDTKISEADLRPYVDDDKCIFYLSGPHGMVDSYETLLKKMGVAEDRIMTDYFPGY